LETIELSDEEKEQALNEAMIKKHGRLEDDRKKRLAEEKRKLFFDELDTPNGLYAQARFRANQILRLETGNNIIEFEPVDFQKHVILAMALYFTNSKQFETLDHTKFNNTGLPMSLNKGLWLWGNPGVGKTLLMQMFRKNKRICYDVLECPKISQDYARDGDDAIAWLKREIPVEISDYTNFNQCSKGVCFNDLGIEPIPSKYYGTPINVMQSIMLESYEVRVPFWQRFVTTNLTLDQVKDLYELRMLDRIKQSFNIIEINGKSLRK
jgi:DNA replication protein DnaC